MPQQPAIDPQTGERIAAVDIDPSTGERITRRASSGSSSSWDPAPKPSVLTQPIGEHIPAYRGETKKLRDIAAGPHSVEQAEEDVKHPVKTGVRRFLAGTEADLGDMLTPLFVGTSAVGAAGEAPGLLGKAARGVSRLAALGFGAKGVTDVAQAGTENTPEAWARRLSGLSQVAASPAAVGGLGPRASREARLSSGAGLTQGEEALKAITPELDATLKTQGKAGVKSIGGFQGLVRDTNGRLETEYQSALQPIKQTKLNTQAVEQAVADTITPNMLNTRDGQVMAKEIWRRAREFGSGKPWTVEELDLERQKLAKTFRDASPSSVAADLKLKARAIADRAANKALNDMLYSMADQAAGKKAGYFGELKQKQSTLFSMADDVKAAKDAALASSAQKKGQLWREKINPYTYLNPKHVALGGGLHASTKAFTDPLKMANEKVRLGFQPAPRSSAPGRAAVVSAAAESVKKHPAPRPMTTDEYSDPANFPQ